MQGFECYVATVLFLISSKSKSNHIWVINGDIALISQKEYDCSHCLLIKES